MTSHAHAATGGACEVCGGPCRQPFKLPPIHDRYPFLPPEVIAMTKPAEEPKPEPAPTGKRAHKPRENRAHTPDEGENR